MTEDRSFEMGSNDAFYIDVAREDPTALGVMVDMVLIGYELARAMPDRAVRAVLRHVKVNASLRAEVLTALSEVGIEVLIFDFGPMTQVLACNSPGDVAPGRSAEARVRPTRAFRAERFVVPLTVAPDFLIEGIEIGALSQMTLSTDAVPAEAFVPDSLYSSVNFDTAGPDQEIVVRVRNTSSAPRRFISTFFGRETDDAPVKSRVLGAEGSESLDTHDWFKVERGGVLGDPFSIADVPEDDEDDGDEEEDGGERSRPEPSEVDGV